ncbi:hypothetical protein [Pseudodesulfovibrio sp.]|uniref:hypothetical protein n=1 Tax=unclassified Pseudodesulfovibrio TaxID=2661612 RepID=UPI003B0004C7
MTTFNLVAGIASIVGALFSLFAGIQSGRAYRMLAKERRRLKASIQVVLQHGSETIKLPVDIRRGDFSRAEVLGRIGMIPTVDGERFQLQYLNTPTFLMQIDNILKESNDGVLTIPCTEQEFVRFVKQS